MKGFIILAVISFLVGVQASSISIEEKEFDIDESKTVESPWMLEELNDTFANGALDDLQNIKDIVDVFHILQNYKDVTGCSGNNCDRCISTAWALRCCKTIRVRYHHRRVRICIVVTNVKIRGGRTCMNMQLSLAGKCRTFHRICI